MVSFTLWPLYIRGVTPRYPLDRRLGGPQTRSKPRSNCLENLCICLWFYNTKFHRNRKVTCVINCGQTRLTQVISAIRKTPINGRKVRNIKNTWYIAAMQTEFFTTLVCTPLVWRDIFIVDKPFFQQSYRSYSARRAFSLSSPTRALCTHILTKMFKQVTHTQAADYGPTNFKNGLQVNILVTAFPRDTSSVSKTVRYLFDIDISEAVVVQF
jgi:hypothetical protein